METRWEHRGARVYKEVIVKTVGDRQYGGSKKVAGQGGSQETRATYSGPQTEKKLRHVCRRVWSPNTTSAHVLRRDEEHVQHTDGKAESKRQHVTINLFVFSTKFP